MIRPLDNPFADWCADKLLEGERLFISNLPADQYWAALDDAAETHDRLEAALARKVEINVR